MTDTVVIALSRFLREAERVAKFLGADVQVYTPTIFSEAVSQHPADCSNHVSGDCCAQDCTAYQ